MQDLKDPRKITDLSYSKITTFVLILLVAALAFMINIDKIRAINASGETVTISQAELNETYGLGVNLVAVTAAGGFVDVRMVILDGEKAKSLLVDPRNLPALSVEDVTLQLSQKAKEQEIKLEANRTLFFMFPNAGNAVRKGMPVTIRFGDLVLEPIEAQ